MSNYNISAAENMEAVYNMSEDDYLDRMDFGRDEDEELDHFLEDDDFDDYDDDDDSAFFADMDDGRFDDEFAEFDE